MTSGMQDKEREGKKLDITSMAKAAALLFLFTLIIYSNSLGGQFVSDDSYFIVKNVHIRNLSNIPYFFINPSAVAFSELSQDVYRPLTTISYAIDFNLWRLNTFCYHLENVLLHSSNAVLLFVLLMLIVGNIFIAFFASLLFALHPVQTEAVAWISGRSSVLFLFFYLSSFICYVLYRREKKKAYFFVSLALYCGSLFSKEMAVSLPLLLAAYDIHARDEGGLKKRICRYAPYFLLAAFFVTVRFLLLKRVGQCDWWGGNPYRTFLTMLPVLVEYVKILIFPVKLCAFYVTPIKTSFLNAQVLTALCLIIALFASMPFIFRRSGRVSFFIWWFLITLLPVSNIVPLRALMAERFLYLPSIGFCVLVAILMERLGRPAAGRPGKGARTAAVILATILVCLYGVRTMARNTDWKDSMTITKSILKVDPLNPWALMALGVAYSAEERYEMAMKPLKKVIGMAGDYFAPKNALGFCYLQLGRYDEAIAVYRDALRIKPNNLEALGSIGVAYASLGKYDEAIKHFKKAIAIDRAYVEGYINLGTAYGRMGDPARAIKEYERVEQNTVSKQDIAISYIRIGDIYMKLKNVEKAKEYYRNAISLCGRGMDLLKQVASDRLNAKWDLR